MYHGAWSMIIVPPLLGIIEGGWHNAMIPLLGMWWVGYFCFYAATIWLRSRMKRRYFTPVLTYCLVTALFGMVAWVAAPYLWRWVPFFVPLIAAAGWAAWTRNDRSLGSGFDTTLAACLMLPVAWDVSTGGTAGLAATPAIWAQTALLFGYFGGTVLYVKTNIRERNSRGYLWASIGWHVVWAGAAVVCALSPALHVRWVHVAVWAILVARAIAVPLRGRTRRISVAAIGVGEIAASAAVLLTLAV